MVSLNKSEYKLAPSILREYDIRGLVGQTLTENDAFVIGRAMATILNKKYKITAPKIVVAYDGRHSSPLFSSFLCEGLCVSGCEVIEIGCGPTPLLYFTVEYLASNAGIMITGSHNPPEFNGFKFVVDGKPFYGPSIKELGVIVERQDFLEGKGSIVKKDLSGAYIESLLNLCGSLLPNKVVWDPGHGATAEIIKTLIDRLPGQHILVNGSIDGAFPSHHPDPTIPENLNEIISIVKQKNYDLGFAFDGDGDRIGVIDELGRIIWGDQLLALLARDVLVDYPGGSIIADVKSSQVVFEEISRLGGMPIIWKTGHSCIKDKMLELSAPLAGEMSGHIFFNDHWFGFDDAIYTALRLLAMLKNSNSSLSQLYDSLPKLVNTPEIRFDCPDDQKFTVVSEVARNLEKNGADVLSIDGVRVTKDGGWWLLRASNTQPVLVARCEAKDIQTLREIKSELLYYLSKSKVTLPDLI
tara:strand:+ start:1001 stop:2407 length:1407 start_codon:yes stop_codon:yes gene_type:complete